MFRPTLERVLEPEVMDSAEEARDYDAMDHVAVNDRFADDLVAAGALGETMLDVGTGTARIPIAICARNAKVKVTAIDLAEHMLAVAARNVSAAKLDERIALEKVDAKGLRFDDGSFAAVVSNSIVHHIPEPAMALREWWRVLAPGGLFFVRDLHRPADVAELDAQTKQYAGPPPTDAKESASWASQRDLLRASLHAALTVEEVQAIAKEIGIDASAVKKTSDRHWTISARKHA